MNFIREQGIKLCVFVDDGLVSAAAGCIVDHRDFVIDTLSGLGLLINYEKSFLEPSTRKQLIDYIVDTEGPDGQPWLYIPKSKIRKLKKDITQVTMHESGVCACQAVVQDCWPGYRNVQSKYHWQAEASKIVRSACY